MRSSDFIVQTLRDETVKLLDTLTEPQRDFYHRIWNSSPRHPEGWMSCNETELRQGLDLIYRTISKNEKEGVNHS